MNSEQLRAELTALWDRVILSNEMTKEEQDYQTALLTYHEGMATEMVKKDNGLRNKCYKVTEIMCRCIAERRPDLAPIIYDTVTQAEGPTGEGN